MPILEWRYGMIPAAALPPFDKKRIWRPRSNRCYVSALRKVRYDLLHWHPTQCRAGLPLRLAHQRRIRPDRHVSENDDLREARRPLYGHAVGWQFVRG